MNNKVNKNSLQEGVTNYNFKGMEVTILSKEQLMNGAIMHGDAVLNNAMKRFDFYQRIKTTSKNKVLARSKHITIRQTQNGKYRATIIFDPLPKSILGKLMSEFREDYNKMLEEL